MSAEDTRKVVSRAVLDEEYRKTLYSDPAQALQGYDLTSEEVNALRAIPAETIDDFANNLEERISLSLVTFGAATTGAEARGDEMFGRNATGVDATGRNVFSSEATGVDAEGRAMFGRDVTGAEAEGRVMSGAEATGAEMQGIEDFGGEAGGAPALTWFQRLAAVLGIGKGGGGSGGYY